jgi:hypothetical protein
MRPALGQTGNGGRVQRHEDKVLRLVAEHGRRVLERGTALSGSQHDGEPPTEVQFLQMPPRRAWTPT